MNTERLEAHALARRYAVAFLNMYEKKLANSDYSALKKAADFFKEHKQACFLMRLSLLNAQIVKKALLEKRKQFGLSDCFDALFMLIYEHKRTFLLADLFQTILHEADERRGMEFFHISYVGQLLQEKKDRLVAWLQNKTGKTVECRYQEDTGLIAGLRLQSKHYLWETSIRQRLQSIASTLKR